MVALRTALLHKYKEYNTLEPARFPALVVNTNRANYERLRESFEEEFFVRRGIDRTSQTIHIPSSNTLALIFMDDNYVPNRKILNTCQSYAEGPTLQSVRSIDTSIREKIHKPEKIKWLLVGGVIGGASVGLLWASVRWLLTPSPGNLVIERPVPHSIVKQEVVVEGRVAHAETVWLVVQAPDSLYYVQSPSKVHEDGHWVGVAYIGTKNNITDGKTFQLRAFVNPVKNLNSEVVLAKWPEAELSSNPVRITRGTKTN